MLRKISFSKTINENFSKVYEQVANFENYYLYIPGCSSSRLIEKNDDFEIGELEFSFMLKSYSIKSKNILLDRVINIEQIEGPFDLFNCKWVLYQVDDDLTEITFESDFKLPFFLVLFKTLLKSPSVIILFINPFLVITTIPSFFLFIILIA